MTPRELFAGLAMAGMLASQKADTLETIANDSVIAADLLLSKLNENGMMLTADDLSEIVQKMKMRQET